MRILLAGDWHSIIHEDPLAWAFRELGHEVIPFKWHPYFGDRSRAWSPARLWGRAQDRLLAGPALRRLNSDLCDRARAERPRMVFVYRGTHVLPATLQDIRRSVPGALLVGYNNDDPFSPRQPASLWRHFLKGLSSYDLVFAYRQQNLDEFRRAGARRTALLRSWYDPRLHRPTTLTPAERDAYASDVSFIGHLEDDGRFEILEGLAARGWRVRIFGPPWEWNRRLARSRWLGHLAPVRLVWGIEYVRAISGARAALCFLSKLNRDSYTRRCFEVPAVGRPLFAERSQDLSELFDDGRNIVLFSGLDELAGRLDRYLSSPEDLDELASRGRVHVREQGHDVLSRARMLIREAEGAAEPELRSPRRDG